MSDPVSRSNPASLPYRSGSGASRTVVDSPWAFEPPTKAGDLGMLGPYRILKELGRGGMGAVFLGVDTRLDRKVALKLTMRGKGDAAHFTDLEMSCVPFS